MMTLGQLWSNSITQNEDVSNVKPVTTNESVVNQNVGEADVGEADVGEADVGEADINEKYHNYKKGILDKVINGGKLNNEPETSE